MRTPIIICKNRIIEIPKVFIKDIAKISIVGRGMRAHAGVASKMFQALAKSEINISMITTSEIKISVVIKKSEMANAVSALHDAFDLDKELDS